jgi:hypothetical protein
MPESQIAPYRRLQVHIFSGYRVVYIAHSSVRRTKLAWPPFRNPQRSHTSIVFEVAPTLTTDHAERYDR